MSRIDSLKANIAFHEKMFFAALAIVLSLTGWIVTNYLAVRVPLLILAFAVNVGGIAFGVYQYRVIKQLIRELENAE